jgi:site-specific recombinase XerD
MTAIAAYVTAFLRDRLPKERACSQHTCDTYAYALKLLFEYASSRFGVPPSSLTIEQLDAPLVLEFLSHLESERGNSPSTRNARLAAIKSLMRFLGHRVPVLLEQVHSILAIPTKRTDQKVVAYLRMTEVEALLNAPSPETWAGLRDRAMLHLCFSAGLRVTELVTLPLSAVTLHAEPAVRVMGKGRRERCLPLWKQAAQDLRAWVKRRGTLPASELFVNARSGPMTRSGFEYILDKHVRAAISKCPSLGEKTITPHVLRHTCAMTILQATGDVRKVSLWLGHANIKTTEAYLRADPTQKLEAIDSVVPPSLRRGRFRVPDKLIALLSGR